MFEQVVNQPVKGIAAQMIADGLLKEILPQHFKQPSAPVTPPAVLAARVLLLEALKLLQRMPYFADA